MFISAFRTVLWFPPSRGYFVPGKLQWPNRKVVSYNDYSLDLSAWLNDDLDTIASVTASTQQAGLQIVPIGLGFSGSVCSIMLRGGVSGQTYTVGFVVSTTGGRLDEFDVLSYCEKGQARFPTSPLMLPTNAVWYNAAADSFPIVPLWSALPPIELADPTAFFIVGGEVHLPSTSSFLPLSSIGLALGDLYNDGGTVCANGNPGLPTSPLGLVTGTLYYNGGPLAIA